MCLLSWQSFSYLLEMLTLTVGSHAYWTVAIFMFQSAVHHAQTAKGSASHHNPLLCLAVPHMVHCALATDSACCCREEVTVQQEVEQEVIPIAVKRQRQKKKTTVEYEDQVWYISRPGEAGNSLWALCCSDCCRVGDGRMSPLRPSVHVLCPTSVHILSVATCLPSEPRLHQRRLRVIPNYC